MRRIFVRASPYVSVSSVVASPASAAIVCRWLVVAAC